jgi:transposase
LRFSFAFFGDFERNDCINNVGSQVDLIPCFGTKLSMIFSEGRGRGMSKSRHTEAQMIGALKQLEAGRKAEDVAREVGVSKHTIYAY